MLKQKLTHLMALAVVLICLSACGAGQPTTAGDSNPLNVVATTTLVGDVVRHIVGDAARVTVLLPVGADPHSFEPTPQDAARLAEADLIFINGAGLEEFLDRLLENAGGTAEVVSVSEGIPFMELTEAHEGEEEPTGEQAHHHEGVDPHVWMDPNLVLIWVDNIEKALIAQDPANRSLYKANAEAYRKQLIELDAWVRQQVDQVAQANRKLVTDHQSLGYFAARYGFEQVGAIIPSFTSQAQPSAQELAALEDTIKALGVRAVFVSVAVNPALAQRLAEDTHIKVVRIYTGSLSEADGPAGTYLDFIRYDVEAIVEALK